MSVTVCLTLTRYTDDDGPWRKAEQRLTWLYPDDGETFQHALEQIDGIWGGPGDSETDEYTVNGSRPYAILRDGLATAGMPGLIPDTPPEGWDDADLDITIYF